MMFKRLKDVSYSATIENLDAIITGLDLKKDDNVLSICSSGSPPLAILEYVHNVAAIDINKTQLDYFQYRISLLKKGCDERFLCSFMTDNQYAGWKKDNRRAIMGRDEEREYKYFNNSKRINTIRGKLDTMVLVHGDIFHYFGLKDYNKIYLSNSLCFHNTENASGKLQRFWDKLEKGTLVYFSYEPDFRSVCPKGLSIKVKEMLTNIAQDMEKTGWTPIILQKV